MSSRSRTEPAPRLVTRRAAARVFDVGVLLLSFVVVRTLLRRLDLPAEYVGALALALAALSWWAYETGLVALRGATVGKRLMFLRVVDVDGRPPSGRAAALRAAPVLLLGFPLFWPLTTAAWLSVLFAPDGRALHDRIAGTRVTHAPWRRHDRS